MPIQLGVSYMKRENQFAVFKKSISLMLILGQTAIAPWALADQTAVSTTTPENALLASVLSLEGQGLEPAPLSRQPR